jgi:branched-chain amino acid transport system substrate-binding protein
MAGSPDGLYLVSYPVDGATIARSWISQGGPAKFLLNDGMNDKGFIDNVGAKYLNDAFGTSSGTEDTASTKYFNDNYKAFSGLDPGSPAAVQAYDAGAIVGLAVAIAGKGDAAAIKDAVRKVVDADGTVVHAGKDEFAKALKLIKDGKPIKYEGVIGPITFDDYGDITGPFRLWRIKDGEVTTVGTMSTADVNAIKAKIK